MAKPPYILSKLEDQALRRALLKSVKIVEGMSSVDRALMESDQRRSWVKGETGRDPGDVMADEVRRLRALLSQEAKPVAQPVAFMVRWPGYRMEFTHTEPMAKALADTWSVAVPAGHPPVTITPLYAAAPDEAHRIEAFEEAAKVLDDMAEREKGMADQHQKKERFESADASYARVAALRNGASTVRALAEMERG